MSSILIFFWRKSKLTEKLGKVIFTLDRNSKINQDLIQRCVDKGLLDENFLQESLDMKMMQLGRRIINQPQSDSISADHDNDAVHDEIEEKNNVKKGILVAFGRNDNTKFVPATAGNKVRQPIEIDGVGEIKERGLVL